MAFLADCDWGVLAPSAGSFACRQGTGRNIQLRLRKTRSAFAGAAKPLLKVLVAGMRVWMATYFLRGPFSVAVPVNFGHHPTASFVTELVKAHGLNTKNLEGED